MKKARILALIVWMLALALPVTAHALDGYLSFDGNVFRVDLFGSSDGEYSQLVRDSLPFQLPGEGEVILLRLVKLGSQITPDELKQVVGEFQLHDKRTDRCLKPVSAITVEITSSTFDLLFYEDTQVRREDYTLLCNGQEYAFEDIGFGKFSPDTRVLRKPVEPLPTMPPEGGFLEEARPEYCGPAEELLKAVQAGQMSVLEGSPRYGKKLAVMVFSDQDVVWKTSLSAEDGIAEMLPADRLAASWDEADTVALISRKTTVVGNYSGHGTARRVDTLLTIVDQTQGATYATATVFSSDPPDSIETNSLYAGGAEGTYEYEKAIGQIAQALAD